MKYATKVDRTVLNKACGVGTSREIWSIGLPGGPRPLSLCGIFTPVVLVAKDCGHKACAQTFAVAGTLKHVI